MGCSELLRLCKLYGTPLDVKTHLNDKVVGVDMMIICHSVCSKFYKEYVLAKQFALLF